MENSQDLNAPQYHDFRLFGVGKLSDKQIENRIAKGKGEQVAAIQSRTEARGTRGGIVGLYQQTWGIGLDAVFGQNRKTLKDILANAKAKRAAKRALNAEEEAVLENEDVITDDSMYDESGVLIGEGGKPPKKDNTLLYVGIGVGSLAVIGIIIALIVKSGKSNTKA